MMCIKCAKRLTKERERKKTTSHSTHGWPLELYKHLSGLAFSESGCEEMCGRGGNRFYDVS